LDKGEPDTCWWFIMAMQTSFRTDCTKAGTAFCAVLSVIWPLGEETDEAEWKKPFIISTNFMERLIGFSTAKIQNKKAFVKSPHP
jgi:hypothetical protein